MRFIVYKAICTAFSTFTAIPTPRVKWDGAATELTLAFLPLPGIVVGACLWGWSLFSGVAGIGDILYATVASALPVLVTGGIHMDGFCDTVDAISSRQPRERKLEILKDPHAGAFAIIYCAVYLLLCFGLQAQARQNALCIAFGYALSRALVAISTVTLPNARGSGMLAGLTKETRMRTVVAMNVIFAVLSCAGMIFAGLYPGIAAISLAVVCTLLYRNLAVRHFGGATGDTSGFYLQITEIAILLGVVAGGLGVRG